MSSDCTQWVFLTIGCRSLSYFYKNHCQKCALSEECNSYYLSRDCKSNLKIYWKPLKVIASGNERESKRLYIATNFMTARILAEKST